jgi:AraC family transcriptional regulator of arabinose operon
MALLAADRRTISSRQADPVEATIEHLRANVSTRISLADLAGMAGLSVSHYSALFRRATGYGALEYQTRLRMGAARELLDTTDRSVASVAAQVGFADPLYFSRQFRRIHGMSPTGYRSHDTG